MKLRYLALLPLLLSACTQTPKTDLHFITPGVTSGVVLLKQSSELVLSQNIKDGKLDVTQQLQQPGYFNLKIVDNNKAITSKTTFDVYLENGDYTIETQPDNLDTYPKITSSSKTQQELSDYYALAGQMAQQPDTEIASLTKKLNSYAAGTIDAKDKSALITSLRDAQTKRREMDAVILKAFVEKYPNNTVGAHLMSQMYYVEDPAKYNEIFQKFSADVKSSDDGIKINNKLSPLLKLAIGAPAPEIAGNTTDGKPFNKTSVKNQITLIEFWRSDSKASQANHALLQNGIILGDRNKRAFGILSVSLDSKAQDWQNAIKSDGLKWPQVSDLKGNDSPNVANWNVISVPVYYLVDKNWHIVKTNISLADVDNAVSDYLAKH